MGNYTTLHFVKKARKDYPKDGIKAGDSYYWWKWYRGPKNRSLTKPNNLDKYSGTTSKEWAALEGRIQQCLDIEERDPDLESELQEFIDQEQEKVDNIPEALEYSDQSEEMRARLEEAELQMSNLECIED